MQKIAPKEKTHGSDAFSQIFENVIKKKNYLEFFYKKSGNWY